MRPAETTEVAIVRPRRRQGDWQWPTKGHKARPSSNPDGSKRMPKCGTYKEWS